MKIAIVVHGRFHEFDVARCLLKRGHDITLFTNYPAWAVQRFGFPAARVKSCWRHGVAVRAFARFSPGSSSRSEPFLHTWFGRWALRQVRKQRWDVVYCWSGIAEEILSDPHVVGSKLLIRASSHIRTQSRILRDEAVRSATPVEAPSEWMMRREEREYSLANRIVLVSTFACDTFVKEHVPINRLSVLKLGASVDGFRPSPNVVQDRQDRILQNRPLRVLFVGVLSFRKGLRDMVTIIETLHSENFEFRLVGPVPAESEKVLEKIASLATVTPKQPQSALSAIYDWADVFMFPTLEDGSPLVLSQASAAALPILTTTNCSGPDVIEENVNGWVLPVYDPDAFMTRLRWCDANRKTLAEMVGRVYTGFKARAWEDVAKDLESIMQGTLGTASSSAKH